MKLAVFGVLALSVMKVFVEYLMTIKIAINGFGRIGRNVLRASAEHIRKDLKIVAINDLATIETNAHMLKYDSIHGNFPHAVSVEGSTINAGFGPINVSDYKNPAELDWQNVDVVLECTGLFTSKEKASAHLGNGSKRVLVSAPVNGADKTIVYGVNHKCLTNSDIIVSNASCTTNCLAPIAKVLNETVGIQKGFMTTIHSYTGDQPSVDRGHDDLYRARAAALNMIPTSTGAARAVGLVLPELSGRIDGFAIRVPTPNVSCIDFTFEASRPTSAEEINIAMYAASEGYLNGILDVSKEKLVSMDFNHNSHSSIFATDQTSVLNGTLCRILAWYDNEWSFSNRMLDTASEIGKYL